MLPHFLIIGVERSATTFIHECLREHPEIFMPRQETPFFEDPDYSKTHINDFEKLFIAAPINVTLGIKRPAYLGKPECAQRIKKHIPKAKLIVVLRNPIERVLSVYFHQMRYGFIPVRPPDKGLTDIINGVYKESYPRSDEIIEFGFYYKHLSLYLKYFNRNQILVLLFSDIRSNPLGSLQKLFQFLSVDNNYEPQSVKLKPQKGVYSLFRLKILTLRNSFLYRYNKERTRLEVKEQKSWEKVIVAGINKFDKLVLSHFTSNDKPILSNKLRFQLYNLYKDDINLLEKLLKLPLDKWKSQ